MLVRKIKNFLLHPELLAIRLGEKTLLVPDNIYLKALYKYVMGEKLDLQNPISFNQKLQWLKIYDHNPKYTDLVDKYEVKKVIHRILGEQYTFPTLGVWNSFDEIDFDKLPNQFVLKCTHDSGGLYFCKDKAHLDFQAAREKINKSLKTNYYYYSREWPYKNVKPRIIAEQLMVDDSGTELKDYKFMCFGGKVKCIFTCTDRYSVDGLKVTFFDTDWNKMPFERHYPSSQSCIPKPYSFSRMVEMAEKLSKGIPFVRVDFYEINRKPYFGEMTFYPGAGLEEFTPRKYDDVLGKWICLPPKTR